MANGGSATGLTRMTKSEFDAMISLLNKCVESAGWAGSLSDQQVCELVKRRLTSQSGTPKIPATIHIGKGESKTIVSADGNHLTVVKESNGKSVKVANEL
jgi:hypothetical protein